LNLDSYETAFLYFYPDTRYYISVEDRISNVVVGSVGRKIVVSKLHYLDSHDPTKLTAYSTSSFVNDIRTITRRAMFPSGSIEFVESDYRLSRETTSRENANKTLPVAGASRAKVKISTPRVTFV